ncbi:MAG: hypothetical protein GY950_29130 [bacterium]|nr:hypothetical protein [bacterium]
MDKRTKIAGIFIALMVAAMLFMWTAPVWAATPTTPETPAENAEKPHGDDHHFDWKLFFGKVVNSTILFGGLIFLLRKPLIKMLSQKSLDVKTDIIRREDLVKTTGVQLEEIKKRLEKIEVEILAMKESAEKTGEDEKKRIKKLGENEAKRIADLTEEEIGNKVDSAVRNLKEKIADLTIDHFKKDIRDHLDKKAHEKLIEKNIKRISGESIERE